MSSVTLLAGIPHGERMALTDCGGAIWYTKAKLLSHKLPVRPGSTRTHG